MLGVIYGTTGELIKLFPILVRLKEKESPTFTICTGQQVEQIPALLDDFGLPYPNLWLSRGNNGHDLERPADVLPWLAQALRRFARHRKTLSTHFTSRASKPLLVVHGDTFTTVLGGILGHFLRIPVAHIEAGLRSGSWRNPFPEELDRVAVSYLARIHFAPGAQAAANLRAMRARGEIVDTGTNTIRDAIGLVPPGPCDLELPPGPFGLVSLHRFELLDDAYAFRAILELLHSASRSTPVLFVDHPVTAAAIAAYHLDRLFDDRFRRVPRQRYFRFISLLKASAFLVTDSGGSEEECAYLGHPCLVHREVTERSQDLNDSVLLSGMDLDVVRAFLADPPQRAQSAIEDTRPTDVILDYLESRGHLPLSPMYASSSTVIPVGA